MNDERKTIELNIPETAEERARMTYGERLVSLDFNPSGNEKVTNLKKLFAEAIDMCADELAEMDDDMDQLASAAPIWREAIMRSLDAQMWCVKAATWPK